MPSSPAQMSPPSEQEPFPLVSPVRCPTSTFSWDAAPWPKNGKVFISVAQDANEQFRQYNEDGHKVRDPLSVGGVNGRALDERWRFFAVYDGHGGRECVNWLEPYLHHIIAAELHTLKTCAAGHPDQSVVAAALKRAFKKADEQLAFQEVRTSGSTATVALVHDSTGGKMLYVANVGDSRAVLVGGSSVRQLSVDHHASNPEEVARVESDGGCVFRRRVGGILSVTRAFGDFELKGDGGGLTCEPDVSVCRVRGAKALVLASDGLWDVLDGMSVRRVLEDSVCRAMKETSPGYLGDMLCATAAHNLVEHAKHLGSHDNICALVVFL